ncbi:carboxyl transferase domain-containing protein [Xanthobacter sp. DSM 24535]|uniref:acetyl-CoA carboxylase family protein n=1 Tax=Roseixanthobacter psychrophilus TaxID=3119917 RepID=UPI00372A5A7D
MNRAVDPAGVNILATTAPAIRRLLIANRGEIAIRIARAAAELGIETVGIHSRDDAESLHVSQCDVAVELREAGPKAYLDIEEVVAVAKRQNCQAIHPGYGFLSENATFARRCLDEGIVFIGPSPETLELFGDKVSARAFARDNAVPLPSGTFGPTTIEEAKTFFASLPAGGAMMIKALAGGGGRGMRIVLSAEEVEPAYVACSAEALLSFGSGALYVEELVRNCRHVEVQIVGDGSASPVALGERECSLQRRNQKVIEIAPCPGLAEEVRQALADASIRMAGAVGYKGLGTFEFLVPLDAGTASSPFLFIEANPRVQVEHTITDQVFGVDLVKAQIRIANGADLDEVGLRDPRAATPKGVAIQCRVNLETIDETGEVVPSSGTIGIYEPPSGLGIRVDGFGYAGYSNSPRFDSLLAKLIVFTVASEDFETILRRARRAVDDFTVTGVATNLSFLANLLDRPELAAGQVHTRFIDQHIAELARPRDRKSRTPRRLADPAKVAQDYVAGPGELPVHSPMNGVLVALMVGPGDRVVAGQPIATVEAMKMQSVVKSPATGEVVRVLARSDSVISADAPFCIIAQDDESTEVVAYEETPLDLDAIREDLAELRLRKSYGEDEQRSEAVAARRKHGKRTARENLHDLVDEGTFLEFGALAIAAQRSRHPVDTLMRTTPGDGIITGIGRINGEVFGPERSSCAVAIYDYTVLAGTQGFMAHKKQDRLFNLANELKVPLVLYAEGGGGRPGDTDKYLLTGGAVGSPIFGALGRLSGRVPLVGVVSGRCFAGNAALLGSCDVIIATDDANLGMAGPAMIDGAGLGVFRAEEIGPASVQERNGVIDVLTRDEREATAAAKKYLSYFQGDLKDWTCGDQRALRFAVPQNRKQAFDIRQTIRTLCDDGSVLELRPKFGRSLVTALVRIEGRPMGLIANDSSVLGGALDADASLKGTRLAQLCDAFNLPLIALVDTPGFMVGPEAEAEALVRKACGLFVAGANLDIPVFTIIVRKCYGLGAQATAAGHLLGSSFCVAWPTGELGGMGFEGAVRLAHRKELAAIADPDEREREFERHVNEMYMRGRGLNAASVLELDDVIDPADTRRWITGMMLARNSLSRWHQDKKRPSVPTW